MTLFEIKEQMATVSAAINQDAEELVKMAADPSTKIEDVRKKEALREDHQKRYDVLKREHDAMEEKQKAALAVKEASGDVTDALVKTKAAFYRGALLGQDIRKAYEALGGIPANDADLGYGDKLLPKNMSNELLVEPIYENPLRSVARITNITGYEEPRLGFVFEDGDLEDVTDKETANEIEMLGDTVTYGRYKMKVKATVSDTVFHGTDLNLVGVIENQLRSGLAMRESRFAFLSATAAASDTDHAHMSFYKKTSNDYDITAKTGTSMYEALLAAYTDLDDKYISNAKILMTRKDYFEMVKELANTAEALFGTKEPTFLGVPVIFHEFATIPVVGDFSYYGINYDIGSTFDVDKDVDKGQYKYVFTAWGDQQIRLHSAFRLAIVSP